MVAACGVQLSHALFLVVDAIVTASVTITMIAAQTSHHLLTTNTVVSKSIKGSFYENKVASTL